MHCLVVVDRYAIETDSTGLYRQQLVPDPVAAQRRVRAGTKELRFGATSL